MRLTQEWREALVNDCGSTTSDCIPHDLIIIKMASHGLGLNDFKLICSILQGGHPFST